MAERYRIFSGAMPTTSSLAKITTTTSIKTLLQVKLGTQTKGEVVAWGCSFDGSSAATPGTVELIETGTIFATVTASVAQDIMLVGDPNAVAPNTSALILGVSATGYNASAEGSIVATRVFDAQLLPPTAPYVYQFPLGQEPKINVSTALRVRVNFASAINAIAWVEIVV